MRLVKVIYQWTIHSNTTKLNPSLLPLLNQGKLVGVLYLENQLATGAFTPERAQVLSIIDQAAIAIENAIYSYAPVKVGWLNF